MVGVMFCVFLFIPLFAMTIIAAVVWDRSV